MRKFAPLFFVLFAFLSAAACGGEKGLSAIQQLREEAQDPASNILRTLSEDEGEILYVDKKAFNENPGRIVVIGQEENVMQ